MRKTLHDKHIELVEAVNNAAEGPLDLIYDIFEDQLESGELGAIDSVLNQIEVGDYPTSVLIAFLTATLPCKNSLPSWSDLSDRISEEIESRGENSSAIMVGLQS